MSILAIAGAGLGGILLSFPAANNFCCREGFWILAATKSVVQQLFYSPDFCCCRSCHPEPIWALISICFVSGILPGAIALALHNLGIMGRLMAEVTEI